MAKKHLQQAIQVLSNWYKKAEEQYQIVSDALSNDFISPEDVSEFQKKKKSVDEALSDCSNALHLALISGNSLVDYTLKIRKMYSQFKELSDTEGFEQSVHDQYEKLAEKYFFTFFALSLINHLRSLPKAKKRFSRYMNKHPKDMSVESAINLIIYRFNVESSVSALENFVSSTF